MLNSIALIGRMTRDPELRATQSGKNIVSFTLAVERDFKGADGNRSCDFVNCVGFDKTAEFTKSYFTKGSLAAVRGRLQIREYEDRDGKKQRAAEVVCDNVYFAESKGKREPMSDLTDADGSLPF